ncbi:hypothetical protein OJ633_001903 [Listeria monocytogenes]|nr:hypothetical protein [Listeria monocytogenes]EKA2554070.1 hypothetical protein [Listeria monocytogenes]EKA2557652.1 hypothetical protein [Listeria monocytogenes]EKA2560776.1 hypothetical protein [Listeria monocytogenes]EKA2563944.1 hypothetical protein [Listeria monocytogenes]
MKKYELIMTREEVYHLHRVLMQDIILSTWGVSTKNPKDEEAFLAHIELSKDLARRATRSEVK